MPRKKEAIKFIVVSHYSGDKSLKDLMKALIMREITDIDTEKKNRDLDIKNSEIIEI